MTPKQVALVQDSFAKVAPNSEAAAALFYDRLFDIAPQIRAMFPDDMIEQRRKLMTMLAGVVKGLGNLEQVLPAASALAKRHVSYGAKAEHYPVVGAALLWTLEKGHHVQFKSMIFPFPNPENLMRELMILNGKMLFHLKKMKKKNSFLLEKLVK